jgi:hypothetical protein
VSESFFWLNPFLDIPVESGAEEVSEVGQLGDTRTALGYAPSGV